ncbi:hypothetical protein NIES4073_11210 [Kalymmatonema gypsitolerans NIES-4073]|nr:hypothetical protein NIES4073_11210 [Scytonema sp. NIES-4073]
MKLSIILCGQVAVIGSMALLTTICCSSATADEDASDTDFIKYSENSVPEHQVLDVWFKDIKQKKCFPRRGLALQAGLSAWYNEKKRFNNSMGFFVVPCASQDDNSQGYSTTTQTNKEYTVIFPTDSNGNITSATGNGNVIVNTFSDLKKYPAGSVGFVHAHHNGPNHEWREYDAGVMCGLRATVFLYRYDHVIERYSLPSINWTQTQANKACLDNIQTKKPVPTRLWKLLVDPSKINTYVDPGVPPEE